MKMNAWKFILNHLIFVTLSCMLPACAYNGSHESDELCSGLLEKLPVQIPSDLRSNGVAEGMAMTISDAIVVDDASYQQMLRFLAGMKSLVPAVNTERFSLRAADYTAMFYQASSNSSVEVSRRSSQLLDCVFDKLGAERRAHLSSWAPEQIRVDFDFRVNTFVLRDTLSEVVADIEIDLNTLGGDGSHICVAQSESGLLYARATVGYGDCPSGCIHEDKYYFSFDQHEYVEYLGMYSDRDEPVGIAQNVLEADYQCR
jgi:hypothetical protein